MGQDVKVTRKPGDVHRWNHQSDVFHGRYVLVEKVKGERNTWTIEMIEPDDETLTLMAEYGTEADLDRAIEDIGHRSTIQFVSSKQWNRAF